MKTNILIDSLPQSIEIDGRDFSIYSDFRTVILIELLIADTSLTNKQKVIQMFNLFYKEIPHDLKKGLDKLLEFIRCGIEEVEEESKDKTKHSKKKKASKIIYSFEHDDLYIYAAFLTQYGIDLNDIEYLHWWKFNALFKSLKDDNKIVEMMGYRAIDISTVSNKKERQRINKMKSMYALPDNRTIEDKVASIGSIFGGGLK